MLPATSALYVVSPPAAEPISLDRARLHLRVDQDYDDDLILSMISAARFWAEDYLGRCLITQQLRWVISEKPYAGAYPFISLPFPVTIYPLWYPWPQLLHEPFELPRAPVQSVDGVAYGTWETADAVLDPSQWSADVLTARVRLHGGVVPTCHDHVTFTFTSGYGLTGAAVPQNIISGILLLLGYLYEHRGDDASGEMPTAVKLLLGTQRRCTFGG